MQMTRTHSVVAIAPSVLAQLRVADDLGHQPLVVVDHDGGSPLRCCLRAARPGEEILLVSYAPVRRWAAAQGVDPAAYDEVGPIFIHGTDCGGPVSDEWPADFRGQPRVLRAYDDNGRILGGTVLSEHDEPEPAVEELLRDDRVAFIHARALVFGCFTFAIERR
jgi:hypothetical protein